MTTLAEKKGFIWFDGKIVNSEEANVHVLTHTLHYGLGVFEGVRAYETPEGTKIFRLNDHTERLFSSAQAVDLEIPYSCLLYTSPSPRDKRQSRMPSSA